MLGDDMHGCGWRVRTAVSVNMCNQRARSTLTERTAILDVVADVIVVDAHVTCGGAALVVAVTLGPGGTCTGSHTIPSQYCTSLSRSAGRLKSCMKTCDCTATAYLVREAARLSTAAAEVRLGGLLKLTAVVFAGARVVFAVARAALPAAIACAPNGTCSQENSAQVRRRPYVFAELLYACFVQQALLFEDRAASARLADPHKGSQALEWGC
jgi:hypothetical protein